MNTSCVIIRRDDICPLRTQGKREYREVDKRWHAPIGAQRRGVDGAYECVLREENPDVEHQRRDEQSGY